MDNFWNHFYGVVGLIGVGFSIFYAYWAYRKSKEIDDFLDKEKSRASEKVNLILTDGKRKIELPHIRREDVTRNEIQGRIGTIPLRIPGNRYSIAYMSDPDYYEQIATVFDGSDELKTNTIEIKCSPAEIKEFDEQYLENVIETTI
jgi:hypothetical protein